MGVAAFDFFCVPPYLTLAVSDYQYVFTFAGMLAVALVISTQTARLKEHATHSALREARIDVTLVDPEPLAASGLLRIAVAAGLVGADSM